MQLSGSWDITILPDRLPATIEVALVKLNVYSSYKPLAYLGSRADEIITTHAILVSNLTSQEIDVLLLDQKYGEYQLSDIVTVLNANAFEPVFTLTPASIFLPEFNITFNKRAEDNADILTIDPVYYLGSQSVDGKTTYYAIAKITYKHDTMPNVVAVIEVDPDGGVTPSVILQEDKTN